MVEIEKPRITCLDTLEDISYGKYVVEPLERGYGMTLGNSLRRIMLSSLPGYAATSIKIAGVLHEFSTIPGVTEDVTEIVLNVKGIIAKLEEGNPQVPSNIYKSMHNIKLDAVIGYTKDGVDHSFMEDYDNVEDLIKEIEEHCSLSRKEKERLRNLECFKEREDIDLG